MRVLYDVPEFVLFSERQRRRQRSEHAGMHPRGWRRPTSSFSVSFRHHGRRKLLHRANRKTTVPPLQQWRPGVRFGNIYLYICIIIVHVNVYLYNTPACLRFPLRAHASTVATTTIQQTFYAIIIPSTSAAGKVVVGRYNNIVVNITFQSDELIYDNGAYPARFSSGPYAKQIQWLPAV